MNDKGLTAGRGVSEYFGEEASRNGTLRYEIWLVGGQIYSSPKC
jgi:hypothetical protein